MLSPDILERVAAIDVAALCDADKLVRVMDPNLRPVTFFRQMVGRARTVRCRDDFLTVIKALDESEPGEVLVVDGGGGTRALAGELFATEAARRMLAGIVIDGACRDTVKLENLAIPIFARSVCPVAGTAERLGTTQQTIVCGGMFVAPGDVVIGDRDGIVVVTDKELLNLLSRAEEIQRAEAKVLERIEAGESLLEMLNFTEHCEAIKQGQPSGLRVRS